MKSISIKFVADTKGFKKGANEVVRIINNVKKGVTSADVKLNKFTKDLNKSAKSMGKFATKAKSASNALGGFNKKVKKSEKSVSIFGRMKEQLGQVASRVPGLSKISSIFPAISVGVMAAVGAVALLGIGIGKAIQISLQAEKSVAAFQVLTGSVEKAKDIMREFSKFAAKTPLSLQEIALSGQTLLSGGVAAKNLTKVIGRLGDVGVITGNRLGDLASFVAKNMKTGILQGEDLNSLFDRRLGPVVEEMSILMKTNVQGLKKLAGEGKVSFSVFEEALKNLTSEGGQFFGGMVVASETLGGKMSTLSDSFADIGREFTGVLAPEGVTTFWTSLKDIIDDIILGVQSFVGDFGSDLQAIGGYIGTSLKFQFKIIGVLLKQIMFVLGPIIKAIGFIAETILFVVDESVKAAVNMEKVMDSVSTVASELVKGFTESENKGEKLRNLVKSISEFTGLSVKSVTKLVSSLLNMLVRTKETTGGISGFIKSISDFMTNFVSKIKILFFLLKEIHTGLLEEIENVFERLGERVKASLSLSGGDKEGTAKPSPQTEQSAPVTGGGGLKDIITNNINKSQNRGGDNITNINNFTVQSSAITDLDSGNLAGGN